MVAFLADQQRRREQCAQIRVKEAFELFQALLNNLRVQVLPFDTNQLNWALHGWRHYGRGRHKAALNLGDCFSYGLAKTLDTPLLFKGEDFQYTDVKVAR